MSRAGTTTVNEDRMKAVTDVLLINELRVNVGP